MSRARAGAACWAPNRRWDAKRRPRLGAQYRQPALHRPHRPRQRALHPRQRQGKLSDADRSCGHGPADRAVPVGATCAWTFDDGDGPQSSTFDCAEPVNFRVRYGRTTMATRRRLRRREGSQRVATEIAVRDIFIAGLGDSIASGEGNPDRPIALSDEGFCFRSYLGARPRNITGRAAPAIKADEPAKRRTCCRSGSARARSGSMPACHRSLYSYQTRTALALAVQYPHIAVTYLPLACTGATIADGLFGSQRARECPPSKSGSLPRHGECASSPNCAKPHGRQRPPARPQARSGAAVGRRQRHLFLRARRRRDRGLRRPSARCSGAAACWRRSTIHAAR